MNSMHLANYLLQYGIKTQVINNFDAEWDIFCAAYESSNAPPLVGISTTFHLSFAEVRRIIKKLRARYPDMDIVLGGAFINEQVINGNVRNFEKPMHKCRINYVLHAFNSEVDLKDLIMSRKKKLDIKDVHNLAYFEKGDFSNSSFSTTKINWNDPILENTPVLWNRLDTSFVNHTVQMRTSSGCPFSCAFCSYPKTARKFCVMSKECVEKHLQSILGIRGVNKIIFIDDTFNVPVSRFKELCRLFCKYDFEWFSFLRVQFINDETVKLMKDSGCKGVYLGIESANDIVLKNMNKKATRAQLLKGLQLLQKNGIVTIAAFIIGFPGETEESIKENIEFIESTGIDFYTLKEFYYMKHTPIYKNHENFGLSGLGVNWKHDTMDYNIAHRKKIEMFKTIKNSIFVDADTNLWYIAYLYDQGYSIDIISKIQREINGAMQAQIDGIYDDNHHTFKNLQNLLLREMANK